MGWLSRTMSLLRAPTVLIFPTLILDLMWHHLPQWKGRWLQAHSFRLFRWWHRDLVERGTSCPCTGQSSRDPTARGRWSSSRRKRFSSAVASCNKSSYRQHIPVNRRNHYTHHYQESIKLSIHPCSWWCLSVYSGTWDTHSVFSSGDWDPIFLRKTFLYIEEES